MEVEVPPPTQQFPPQPPPPDLTQPDLSAATVWDGSATDPVNTDQLPKRRYIAGSVPSSTLPFESGRVDSNVVRPDEYMYSPNQFGNVSPGATSALRNYGTIDAVFRDQKAVDHQFGQKTFDGNLPEMQYGQPIVDTRLVPLTPADSMSDDPPTSAAPAPSAINTLLSLMPPPVQGVVSMPVEIARLLQQRSLSTVANILPFLPDRVQATVRQEILLLKGPPQTAGFNQSFNLPPINQAMNAIAAQSIGRQVETDAGLREMIDQSAVIGERIAESVDAAKLDGRWDRVRKACEDGKKMDRKMRLKYQTMEVANELENHPEFTNAVKELSAAHDVCKRGSVANKTHTSMRKKPYDRN